VTDDFEIAADIVYAKLAPIWRQRDAAIRGRSQVHTYTEAQQRALVEQWIAWAVREIVPEIQRVMTRSEGEYRSSSYEPGLRTTLAADDLVHRAEGTQ
jgi:hypothetical protein